MFFISNTEFLIIICIIIFQPFTNTHTKLLFLILFLIIHNIEFFKNIYYKKYKNNLEIKKIKNNQDLDKIISLFFKNTNLNKKIYSILLSNIELIRIVKQIHRYSVYDPGMFKQFIYSLWDFLKLFGHVFHFKTKKYKKREDILFEFIEKRNRILMSLTFLSFELNNKKLDKEVDKYIDSLFILLNIYIKMVQKKFNIIGDLPPIPINVVDEYIIF